jgi:DsbC/DsbD-like thiol-disulfide interchange protein
MTRTLLASAALALFAGVAGAQTPVHWSGPAKGTKAATGATIPIKVSAKIDEGWHIYSLTTPPGPTPTRISLPKDLTDFLIDGTIKQSDYAVKFDDAFGSEVQYYEREAIFTVPLKVASTAKAGKQEIEVLARYQVCNSSGCLPPQTDKIKVSVEVASKK